MSNEIIIERILRSVIPVLIIILVGFAYGRLRRPDMDAFNKICMELLVPILIVSVLASKNVDLSEYLALIFGVVFVILGCGALAAGLCSITRLQHKTFIPPMMFTNTGNLAFPLVLLAYGEEAMPSIVVIFLVSQFLHFTLGFYILDRNAKVINSISLPTILATFLGIFIALTPIEVPNVILIPLDFLANAGITLVLFSLGVRMQAVTNQDVSTALIGSVACPAFGIALAFMCKPFLGLNTDQWNVFLLFASLPPAVLCYMLAERYNQEPACVASIVLIGNIASIFWVPLALALAS